MKLFPICLSCLSVTAIAACVPQPRSTPPVQTRPVPSPTPLPQPTAVPVTTNWMDAPATPGDWRYIPARDGGTAIFSAATAGERFVMRCDAQARIIVLSRSGQTPASQIVVRTESQTRSLATRAAASPALASETSLSASDRLFDAMALSKGRFAVEVKGQPPLYLPSWAEVTRVIEDCR